MGKENLEPVYKAALTNPAWVFIEGTWFNLQIADKKLYVDGALVKEIK